jgi:lauroyl/myristoyl acyltransferase
LAGIGQRTSAWLNTGALLWSDEFNTQRWAGRLGLTDLERITDLTQTRPVILVSLHFGGIFTLPAMLRSHGIPTASVVGGKLWPIRWWRKRRALLTEIDGLPNHLKAGDAWAAKRFLAPGRCILVAIDFPMGEQVRVGYKGSSLDLSTPPFRLARLTGAAVVPVLVRADRIWRFTMIVGQPVPDELIESDDFAGAAAHIANQLLPIAADRPEQAMPLLVASFVEPAAT